MHSNPKGIKQNDLKFIIKNVGKSRHFEATP